MFQLLDLPSHFQCSLSADLVDSASLANGLLSAPVAVAWHLAVLGVTYWLPSSLATQTW